MKTILVPTDFTAYAEAALDFAVQLGKKNDTSIKLLHVIEYPLASTFNVSGEITTWDPMDKVFTLELIKRNKEQLRAAASKYDGENVNIDEVLLIGNPFEGIGDQLKETDADLIVMGTKGATGLKEIFVGSNAEKVVRNATCPVITVHQKRNAEDINDIVFATDLDSTHGHVLEKFKAFQEMLDANIHLIWINTPHSAINESVAKEELEAIAKKHGLKNYTTKVGKGFQPEDGILAQTHMLGADMIALATHSYKGLLHLFVGSIAEDVVNHATIPVWTCTTKS